MSLTPAGDLRDANANIGAPETLQRLLGGNDRPEDVEVVHWFGGLPV
jgi:hypothetical protein